MTVVAFAAGSSSVGWAVSAGRGGRWVALILLLVAAAGSFARLRERPRMTRTLLLSGGPIAAFAALAVVSSAWSVDPRLSFARAGSFCLLVAVAASVAAPASMRRRTVQDVLLGVVLGAGVVALLGVVLLAASYGTAVQTAGGTWRFRGFGMNPNTAPMLFALALPPAAGLALWGGARRMRVLAGAIGLLMSVEVVLSGSRGAVAAAFVGLAIPAAVLLREQRDRTVAALVAASLGAFLAAGFGLRIDVSSPPSATRAPSPAATVPGTPTGIPPGAVSRPGGPVSVTTIGGTGTCKPRDKVCVRVLRETRRYFPDFRGPLRSRPEDEIGHPIFNDRVGTGGSGRLAAWRGTLQQVGLRPALGYGFGTEAEVFVDRWYYFQGSLPENSFLGLLLQVGGIGLLLLALGAGAAFVCGLLAVRRRDESRMLLAVLLGVVAAGVALMLGQSYVYSVGNVATASFWISVFLLAAVAGRGGTERTRRISRRGWALAVLALALGLGGSAALGRAERARYLDRETAKLGALFDAVGRRLDARSLSAYRAGPPDCFWYQAGRVPFGISLCFDRSGRLVEGSDRRSGSPVYWSIEPVPAAATVRVDSAEVRRLLARLDAIERVLRF